MDIFTLTIGGEPVAASDGRTESCLDPSTGAVFAAAPVASEADCAAAVGAAAAAVPGWRDTPVTDRAQRLRTLARTLREQADSLSTLESTDCGNPIRTSRNDIEYAAAGLEYFAGIGLELKGDTIPVTAGGWHLTRWEPYGVVLRITAFNHPLMFAASRIAAPLLAGNSVVLKPAPQAPLSTLVLGRIAAEILPPGVLNVLNGPGPTVGARLAADPRVRRIGVTGSVGTGRAVLRTAAATMAQVSLELGGKNPMIVFPDADPVAAADAAVEAMNFGWQGQSCGSTSRLLVHRSLVGAVTERVVERVRELRVGPALDPATGMGPLISRAHQRRVLGFLDEAVAAGARALTGGGRPDRPELAGGFYVEPTVFDAVRPELRIATEEVFGPVLSILGWDDEQQALQQANATPYGLTACLWTNDLDRVLRLVPLLEAGYVWVNGRGQHWLGLPFGGYKDSGLGREEGIEELRSYSQLKSVSLLPGAAR
ncbi:MAG: aldehyde dehydrogenase family protein [Micromonosporaceae bacterium]|nr:aldehyde dehydrogenase family protein [Micromonosporaceae bacterium]